MRALVLLLVLSTCFFALATPAEAAPCNGKIVEREKCGIGGERDYVCGEQVLNWCIWGP